MQLEGRTSKPTDIKNRHRRSLSVRQFQEVSIFEKTSLTSDQIQMLLLRHLQQTTCNVHMVTTLSFVEVDNCDASDTESIHCEEEYTVRREQREIALALYPTASLLNHACDPDVIVRYVVNSPGLNSIDANFYL